MQSSEEQPLLPTQENSSPVVSKVAFRIILSCLFANIFLASLDSTMVATLLGRISSDFSAQEHISWVASSYLLSCAAFQPLFGKLSDVFGRKPIILFSTMCFAIGCFMCGAGDSFGWLVLGRFITGIGGGGFTSLATITCSDLVSMRQRGLYQGYINIFFHAGAASGGLIAGIFDAWVGWKWAFLAQVPICLVSGLAVYLWFELPPKNTDNRSLWEKFITIDWTGATILVTSLLTLMIISGSSGKELNVGSNLWIALLVYTIVGFIAFYIWESKVEEPVIPVKMLHNQTVLASSLNCWFTCMNMFASLFYLPFYWSSVKNLSPLDCGYRLIPSSIIASITSIFAGWVIKKTSKYRTLHISSGWCLVFGSIFVYWSTQNDGFFKDSIISLPLRYGASVDITVILVAMISAVSNEEQALVTSIQYGFRSTGSTMGVSIAGALMQYILKSSIDLNFGKLTKVPDQFSNPELIAAIKKHSLEEPDYAFNKAPLFFKKAIIDSYDKACHSVFIFLIAAGIASLITIYYTEENDLEEKK